MPLKFFQSESIKTQVTLSTLAIFVVSIWVISFYVTHTLQSDMQRILGGQQFETVSMVAGDINSDVQGRLDALESITTELASVMPGGAAAAQKTLKAHQWGVSGNGFAKSSLPEFDTNL